MSLCKLAEQCTMKQQDTETIAGEASNLDTKISESTVEATESNDSLTLSLVDAKEIFIQDSFLEEVILDAKVEDGNIEEYSKKSRATITIRG